MVVLLHSSCLAQRLELSAILLDQLKWGSLLDEVALVHHKNLGAGHDGLHFSRGTLLHTHSQPMGNDEHSHPHKFFMNHSADLCIRGRINTGCCFIQDQDLVLLQ